MKNPFTLMLVMLLLISTAAWAQQGSVSGTVTSADDGGPLPGVTVVIKGTMTGTITDVDA